MYTGMSIEEFAQELEDDNARLRSQVATERRLSAHWKTEIDARNDEIASLRTQLYDAHARLAEHIAEHGTPGHIDVGDYVKERITGRVGKVTGNTFSGAFLFVTWVGDSEQDGEPFSPSELELLPKHEEVSARLRDAVLNFYVGIDLELLRELVLGEQPQTADPFAPGTYVTGKAYAYGHAVTGVVSSGRNTTEGTLLIRRQEGSRHDGEKYLLFRSTVRRLFPCAGVEPPSDVTVVRETGAALTPFLVRHPNGGWEWTRDVDDPSLLDSGDPWSETVFNALSKTLVEHLPHDPA